MRHSLTLSRDHYAGILTAMIGLGALLEGCAYGIGSLTRIGPGFLPASLGGVLLLVGILIGLCAHRPATGDTAAVGPRASARGLACIVAAILLFIGLSRYAGFVPAVFATTAMAASGDRQATTRGVLALAVVVTVLSVGLFHYLLGIQLPLLHGRAA